MVASCESIVVDDQQESMILRGMSLPLAEQEHPAGQLLMAYNRDGEIIAVLKRTNEGLFHPDKVFASPDKTDEIKVSRWL
jgi:hypothetical protein